MQASTKRTTPEQVETYRRDGHDDEKGVKAGEVQIISTKGSPLPSILDFYTTAVCNIITWNKAYALFPYETFIEHKTLLLKQTDSWTESLLLKYERRGWKVKMWDELTELEKWDNLKRSVGDQHTWQMDLDTRSLEQPWYHRDEIFGKEFALTLEHPEDRGRALYRLAVDHHGSYH